MKKILIFSIAIIGLTSFTYFNKSNVQKNKQETKTKSDTLKITVLQTADIHGQLDPHNELFWENGEIVFKTRGGLANIKTLFDQERKKNPGKTLIVDGGDLIQGSGYAARSEGEIFSDIINEMNYDVLIPGNWEVIYGKDQMLKVMQGYKTPIIAQNMKHEHNKTQLFPPHWVKEINGIKLGFVGLNDPDVPVRQNPIFSKGIDFNPWDENMQQVVDHLKEKEKVDVLFLITHIGIFKQVELANNPVAKNVDYILGNDTHERVRKPIQGKYAKVTEPGAFGSFVGKLTLNFVDGKLVGDDYELLDVDPAIYPADANLQALVDKAKAPYKEEMEEIIGYTNTPLYRYLTVENPMDNLITDATKWKTGADVAISNGFRFGNPIVPENGEPAPITKANLWNMLPVNEKVKVGKVTGLQIKNWLEKEINNAFSQNPTERFGGWLVRFSGMKIEFDSQGEMNSRVKSIKINGKPIKRDKYYTIASCVRPGDPLTTLCRLPNAKDIEVKDYTVHDVFIDYLKEHSPVSPVLEKRAYCEHLGTYSFSTVPQTDYEFK